MAKLTLKQQCFVQEYLIDLNATQAAIRAGYSAKNADKISSELMGKTGVAEAVEQAMAKRSRRTGINQDRIINELAKIAFLKITDVVDDKAKIRDDASEDDLSCIESIKYKKYKTGDLTSEEREVKAASKLKALELLGKHLGMFTDKLNVDLNLPVFMEGEDKLEE